MGIQDNPTLARNLRSEIESIALCLGLQELQVLRLLAARLLAGQTQYGRLDVENDKRDWQAERAEETTDLLIYAAIEELKRTISR